MALDPITAGIDLVNTIVGKFSSGTDKAKFTLELERLKQEGELDFLHSKMSAILAEAQSTDPWTSRARPAFLYVIYILILMSIPMAIIHTIDANTATTLISGFHGWLEAIPERFVDLFGMGYLGYAGGRTVEKTMSMYKK